MMKRLTVCLAVLAVSMPAFAGEKDVEELLAAMRKSYKEIKTAAFKLESTVQGNNGDITVTMDGVFKSPNKIAVDMNVESRTIKVICDGKSVFAMVQDSPTVFSRNYSLDTLGAALMYANLEVINFYDWKRQLSTAAGDNMHDSKLSIRQNEKWNGRTWIVLEEAAPTVGVYVEYYIDPKTNLVWRTVRMSLDKEFVQGDFILKSLKTGVDVEDSRFKKPVIAQ